MLLICKEKSIRQQERSRELRIPESETNKLLLKLLKQSEFHKMNVTFN
jgi:hypothetical protein